MPLRNATPAHIRSRYELSAWHPLFIWLLVLALIALVESGLMLLLPMILPAGTSRGSEAVLDALLLSLTLAPVLWWLLLRPLQRATRLRDRFLTDLFQTIENERRNTARDLHDGVGQQLGLLVTGLKSLREGLPAEELVRQGRELRELAQEALRETKRLALGLRPSLLDDLGLAVALERLTEQVSRHQGLDVDCKVDDLTDIRLPELYETTLFRIAQEALQNVVRHSAATAVSVKLRRSRHELQLEILDNGRGVSTSGAAPPTSSNHMGLVGMSERASLAGGTFLVETAPGGGTRVFVTLPCPEGAVYDRENPSCVGG
jgi:signal transduction histidine kinase